MATMSKEELAMIHKFLQKNVPKNCDYQEPSTITYARDGKIIGRHTTISHTKQKLRETKNLRKRK